MCPSQGSLKKWRLEPQRWWSTLAFLACVSTLETKLYIYLFICSCTLKTGFSVIYITHPQIIDLIHRLQMTFLSFPIYLLSWVTQLCDVNLRHNSRAYLCLQNIQILLVLEHLSICPFYGRFIFTLSDFISFSKVELLSPANFTSHKADYIRAVLIPLKCGPM